MLGNDLVIAFAFILAVISMICVLFTQKKLLFAGISLGLFAYFYIAASFYNIADNVTLITFIAGISLLSLELFIPSFGLIGVAGLALTIYSVMDSFIDPRMGLFVVLTTGLAILATVAIFVKLGFKAELFEKSILETKPKSIYTGKKDELSHLVGSVGITKTILRPAGRIEIDGELYDAMARAEFIEKGKMVSVADIKDGHIRVKEI